MLRRMIRANIFKDLNMDYLPARDFSPDLLAPKVITKKSGFVQKKSLKNTSVGAIKF